MADAKQEKGLYEVMVSQLRVVISWRPSVRAPHLVLDLVCPPVPLLSTGSEHLFAAMHKHPLLASIHTKVKEPVGPRTWVHQSGVVYSS